MAARVIACYYAAMMTIFSKISLWCAAMVASSISPNQVKYPEAYAYKCFLLRSCPNLCPQSKFYAFLVFIYLAHLLYKLTR